MKEQNQVGEVNNYGREILVTYQVIGTGEVLWKDMAWEDYVDEVKKIGMNYESIRKLNGLD